MIFRNKEVLLKAANEIGTIEWEVGSNPKVEKYLDHGYSASNKDTSLTDDTPWCGGFVAYCLEKVGMGSTNSLMARSYENWGRSVRNDPRPGDIVTFWRRSLSSGYGHVGFVLKATSKYVWVIGGNQNDEVNITRYSTSRVTDYRRSSKHLELTQDERLMLHALSSKILNGETVQAAGSVV